MAHELEIRDGTASMMYVGEPPWHGLGMALNKPATAAEAIQAARLDWSVRKVPLCAVDSSVQQRFPDRFALVREDRWGKSDFAPLGIVGGDYKPLQNRDAFSFFDDIVGQGAAIFHTAGVLGKGERVWMLAKLPGEIRVVGDDIADKYLLLSNNHDGHGTVQVKFTPIRVVCRNTLTMALNWGKTVRVAHTRNLAVRLRQAQRLLGIVNTRYATLTERFEAMARVQMSAARLDEYLVRVFPLPSDPGDARARERVQRDRRWSACFFDQGRGNRLQGVTGTLWAAYNGVVEYVDHRTSKQQTADRRLGSVLFGDGYLAKARAYRVADALMGGWSN